MVQERTLPCYQALGDDGQRPASVLEAADEPDGGAEFVVQVMRRLGLAPWALASQTPGDGTDAQPRHTFLIEAY
jgi:hypothetical protein